MFARAEVRFALRKAPLCAGCRRTIDEEDYTRDVYTAGDGGMLAICMCRDCRPIT